MFPESVIEFVTRKLPFRKYMSPSLPLLPLIVKLFVIVVPLTARIAAPNPP